MSEFFSSEFFAGNRERLRQLFTGTAPIVVTANGLLQRNGDSPFPFQQDANFWYLTGIDEPDILLVMDKDKEYLIVPGRETSREAFDGRIDEQELRRRSGIELVNDEHEGWRQLAGRLKRAKHVATLAPPPVYVERHGLYTNPARLRLLEQIKAVNEEIELLDLGKHIVQLRVIKHTEELAAIQAAIDLTLGTLNQITKPANLKKYAYEYEIEADLTRYFRRAASGHGFDPIVASGERACTLHNVSNNGVLTADELLILDIGAQVDHYSADITRTVALGNPSRRQRAVHEAVLETQDYARSLLKPGVIIKDYEADIEHFIGEKLRALGLIRSAIDHDEVRHWYPHATSHFLGLNVHDVGDYASPLEPGMVLTIEPGIYIPEEGIGVRIEDDVLVTARGIKVLSNSLPRELASPTIK